MRRQMAKDYYDYWIDWHLGKLPYMDDRRNDMYPKQVKIGDNVYTVHLLPNTIETMYGKTLRIAERIYLNPQMSAATAADTLMHEIIHAIYTVTGLDDTEEEETLATTLGLWLPMVLRRNPEVLEFILHPHKYWIQSLSKDPDKDVLTDD